MKRKGIIITVTNHKGGVAKTTTTAALGVEFSERGYKVLLVDADPQGNLSSLAGANSSNQSFGMAGIVESFCKEDEECANMTEKELAKHRKEVVRNNIFKTEKYDIIPASEKLYFIDKVLQSQMEGSFALKMCFEDAGITNDYDIIIIDTQPSLGAYVVNALVAADYVLIPVLAGKPEIEGIGKIMKNVSSAKKLYNQKLEVLGVVRTRWETRNTESKAANNILEGLEEAFDIKLFDTIIRKNNSVSKSTFASTSIKEYDKSSIAAADYASLTSEIETMLSLDGD